MQRHGPEFWVLLGLLTSISEGGLAFAEGGEGSSANEEPSAEAILGSPEVEARKVPRVGEEQFMRDCASCHGPTGTGDGYLGALLAQPPANLQTIAQRNGGKFPTLKIARFIDGRERVIAHGPRDMPVWGKRFRSLGGPNRDSAVRGEVMLYVAYLRSIQEP